MSGIIRSGKLHTGPMSKKRSFAGGQSVGGQLLSSEVSTRKIMSEEKGATVEGGISSQKFRDCEDNMAVERTPAIIKIRLKGISQKKYGIYLGHQKDPYLIFSSEDEALRCVSLNDFGTIAVNIRPC